MMVWNDFLLKNKRLNRNRKIKGFEEVMSKLIRLDFELDYVKNIASYQRKRQLAILLHEKVD